MTHCKRLLSYDKKRDSIFTPNKSIVEEKEKGGIVQLGSGSIVELPIIKDVGTSMTPPKTTLNNSKGTQIDSNNNAEENKKPSPSWSVASNTASMHSNVGLLSKKTGE